MSLAKSAHTQSGGMEGLDDPDLTPKPLRIVKRGNSRKPETINTSRTLSSLSTERQVVPRRTSSVSSASYRPAVRRQDLPSKVRQQTGREMSLHLAKRRRNDFIDTTTAADARNDISRKGVHHWGMKSGIRGIAEYRPAEVNTRIAVKSPPIRSITAGAFDNANVPSAISDENQLFVPPTPLVPQRRAVTDTLPIRAEVEATRHAPSHGLCRQDSIKKGFITRMMDNIAHRSRHSPAAAMSDNTSKHRSSERISGTSAQNSQVAKPPGRLSESSGRTDLSKDSHLDGVLAAFPTPPTSVGTSPRVSEMVRISRSESQQYRTIHKPEHTSIMGAELTLTAEHQDLKSDDVENMLVAIDIEGATNSTPLSQDLWSQHTGLDMVVIIDNSLCTSPTMLMASCETTRALASMLNVVTDRLAILCTTPINDHRTLGSEFTKIWPLSSIRVRKLKAVLDAVVNTKEETTTFSWTNTIKVATETLLHSAVLNPDTELLQDTFGHVIILTANVRGLPDGTLTHEKIQFHVACPTTVPLSDFDAIDCNGWKLRSTCSNESQTINPHKGFDPTTLLDKLRRLILHARSGRDVGKLTYLSLDIKAGPNCSIQNVMGKSAYLTLHPGELRTVLVKLKIHASEARETQLACSNTLPEMGPGSVEILKELDEMLKVVPRPTKILAAKLKYKHSLLPAATTCSVDADCKVNRRTATSVCGTEHGRPVSEEPAQCTTTVHQRLAYYLATYDSPKSALSAFKDEFGEDGWRSQCPDYTHLILEELKYQGRIQERLEIDASPKKPLLPLTMKRNPSLEDGSERFLGECLRGAEQYMPESWSTYVPDADTSNPNDSHRALIADKEMTVKLEQGVKHGVKICWSDLAKTMWDPTSSTKGYKFSVKQEEQHNTTQGRLVAVRHQRSGSQPIAGTSKSGIGALTLRRITSAGESLGRGFGAV